MSSLGHDGPLTTLTVSSPPLNLLDEPLIETLEQTLDELERRPPRTLLIQATGKVVTGGVDVALFQGKDKAEAEAFLRRTVRITQRVEDLPCPVVFAAHALCLTWAFELALACDVILAARSARFGLIERVVGLTPAMGGTQRLAERAGTGRAREFVMTGERFDAETLERWNVVNRLLPDEDFHAAAAQFARGLAIGPPLGHAATKEVIAAYTAGGVRAADAAVPRIAGRLFESEDAIAAFSGFLEHGPSYSVTFEGR
jgi:enoyl-CoA hydratase/carnithine racemase